MRSTSALHFVFVFSLTTSSLCAPIPVLDEECSHYASCTPYHRSPQWLRKQQSKEASHLQEPHFPDHQLELSKHADTVEVGLLEHHLTKPQIAIQPEPPIKNLKLNAILKASHGDKASTKKKLHELEHKSSSTEDTETIYPVSKSQLPSLQDPELKKHSFIADILNKVLFTASSTRGRKCGMMDLKAKDGDGGMIITYFYGYRYMRTDYTSVLVVSIVVIFFLVIILVELLDKVIEISRVLLGLDQGAIRLEDYHCECHDACPPYEYAPEAFRLMPAPPPRSARSSPRKGQAEVLDEKNQGGQSELP